MGWLGKLYGTIVGLDTAPLIYFVELHPRYLRLLDPFFDAVDRGDIQVVTTMLTLTEVLVHPYQRDDQGLVDQYSRMLLNTRNLITLPVSSRSLWKQLGFGLLLGRRPRIRFSLRQRELAVRQPF
jgi:hypothetical protein